MIDRDKVIKGLETCNKYGYECPECPYYDPEDEDGCHSEELLAEALVLIKEQEPVRCKDCVKREYDNCPFNEYTLFTPDDDFFCKAGSREWEDDEDD